jgi:uncharacterized phage protein gp47/JayE
MDIDELQNLFFGALLKYNSPLTDFRQGSAVYTIARAAAVVANTQTNLLDEFKNNSSLDSAKGQYLDDLASSYLLSRKVGSFTQGYVLANNYGAKKTIQANTVLTNPDNGYQYIVTSSTVVNSIVETKVPIKATSKGKKYNLKAGTMLVSTKNDEVSYRVGSYRDLNSNIGGDLSSGTDTETDTEFRYRLRNFLLFSKSTNSRALSQELYKFDYIKWIGFQVPIPGFLTVWVEADIPLQNAHIEILSKVVEEHRAAGILTTVVQASIKKVDFTIKAENTTAQIISTLLSDYLNTLEVEAPLSIASLEAYIKNNTEAVYLKIIEPSENIFPDYGEIIRADNITVALNV